MSYNYQDAPRESQQEYFGKVHTDNKETLYNALKRIEELERENAELKHNKKTVAHLSDCLEEKMKDKIAELEKENAELKVRKHISDCVEYCKF